MRWTVGRRIATGFVVGLSLVAAVAVVGTVALRGASRAYQAALDHERRTLVPALDAESEFRRANLDFLRYLLGPEEQHARSRDSTLAVSRRLVLALRDSARAPESQVTWDELLTHLADWDRESRAAMAAATAGRASEALRIRDTGVAPTVAAARVAFQRGIDRATQATEAAVLAAPSRWASSQPYS
jgi:CHASE3 domain sensor protein